MYTDLAPRTIVAESEKQIDECPHSPQTTVTHDSVSVPSPVSRNAKTGGVGSVGETNSGRIVYVVSCTGLYVYLLGGQIE
jgi:hypothetical protein